MGAMTTPSEMAEAIGAVVPGAKVKFEAPAGTAFRCRTATTMPN